MHEILRNLTSGARVLDLGSRSGSFTTDGCREIRIVRLDLELPPPGSRDGFVQADAARLPFADRSFDAVIASHSLEHMAELGEALQEIGRVVRSDGSLFVAVPDASTFTDHLYRWVYHGGGHVNAFRCADALAEQISKATGLKLVATRILHSSFQFLDHSMFRPRAPRRLWLLGNGNPKFIAAMSYAVRVLDRLLRTRTSIYGWAFYFGDIREEVETVPWTNVCAGCGAAQSAAALTVNRGIRRWSMVMRSYICPYCGAWNLFTEDFTAGRRGSARSSSSDTSS
jgi:SAM-dependent methyltransferase